MNKKEFKIKANKKNKGISKNAVTKYEKIEGQTINKAVNIFLKGVLKENNIPKEIHMYLSFDESLSDEDVNVIIKAHESLFEQKSFILASNSPVRVNDECTISINWDFEETEED